MSDRAIQQLIQWLKRARYPVALTGAGVSTESGIPDFRSAACGLWKMIDPFKVASLEGFLRDTQGFYEFWQWRFAKLSAAEPNITHTTLVKLEERGLLKALITQNIDDLHRAAGSQRLYEVHGSYKQGVCIGCGDEIEISDLFAKVREQGIPRCSVCNGLLKPNVVLFGEMMPPAFRKGVQEVLKSDLLLVLGASLEVYPVADLVPQAKYKGARVVVINRDKTPIDAQADLVIPCELGAVMRRLGELLGLYD
ncbi:Sir2 family NAD-dependent protein deacetylase [Candidatus Acetothermia bacterium]|nr:Sir2 family NAD-dependent protein deacetylase [Candidatus Acetothermia bacterium]MBI3643831.1 Sir2 family NAD-dependent protein deacetylase [Candidatus Acetothermia bacterium]